MKINGLLRRLAARAVTASIAALALSASTIAHAGGLGAICDDCQFEKWASCGQFLEGINFDRNGHAWAVSLFNGDIIEVSDGKCEVRAKSGGRANGARFHKDGRLFVTDNERGIVIFDPSNGSVSVFADSIGGEPMVNANDLVFDMEGGLYVTVPGTSDYVNRTGKVVYFAPGSNDAKVILDNLPYGNGIALQPDGMFVNVGLYDAKSIITIPSVTNAASPRRAYVAVHTEGGIGPDGMAMDSDGRIYWANFLSGAIGVTDERGFVLGYIRLPADAGTWTTNLAFHDGYIYVTEAAKGEIWRVKVKTKGQDLFYRP